jgi:hypothetical protein
MHPEQVRPKGMAVILPVSLRSMIEATEWLPTIPVRRFQRMSRICQPQAMVAMVVMQHLTVKPQMVIILAEKVSMQQELLQRMLGPMIKLVVLILIIPRMAGMEGPVRRRTLNNL